MKYFNRHIFCKNFYGDKEVLDILRLIEFWYNRVDSNHRPLPCQGSALTN